MGGRGSGRRTRYKGIASFVPEGPYPCFFQCGNALVSKTSMKAYIGWTWFTGYGHGPLHFCPDCIRARPMDIQRIKAHMDRKPEGYPDVRVDPPQIENAGCTSQQKALD